MKFILDTHTFLWFIGGDDKLSPLAKSFIENADNQCFISIASLWEMTIKSSLGKLKIPLPIDSLVSEHILANDFNIIDLLRNRDFARF